MDRGGELGELSVCWFSFESHFSPRISLCINFGKVFLNSLWDHSQVTKSLHWMCPEKLGSGASAAVIVVWVWLGGGDFREASWSGCSQAGECSCWGAQVWMNWWGQTCDLSLLLIFVSCKICPVSAIHYYAALKCRWSLHWTVSFKCFQVALVSSFWCVKVPLCSLCLKLPRRLKSPQGSLVVKNAFLCQSCECGWSSPWVPCPCAGCGDVPHQCLCTSRHSQLPSATVWISELVFPTSAISCSFTPFNKYINVFSAWTVVLPLIGIFPLLCFLKHVGRWRGLFSTHKASIVYMLSIIHYRPWFCWIMLCSWRTR